MARKSWLLHRDLPVIEVVLREPFSGFTSTRTLLADTGAGSRLSPVEIVLSHNDGRHFGLAHQGLAGTSGAIQGQHPVVLVSLEIPALGFQKEVDALVVPADFLPANVDGFACFRFLNAFCYGNFGDRQAFGLEWP